MLRWRCKKCKAVFGKGVNPNKLNSEHFVPSGGKTCAHRKFERVDFFKNKCYECDRYIDKKEPLMTAKNPRGGRRRLYFHFRCGEKWNGD